ncbi:MAG: hypothetical protein D6720_06370 [Gammaproteobacteria bacterium]|nr:MAG: hypothetical protein D6720_06370 [Gammaproteobacteria bacterium]
MSDQKAPRDPVEVLGQAYEKLFETVAEEWKKVEEKTEPVLHELILKAKEKLLAAEEITEEQGERLAEYLERDLQDMGRHLAEEGRELKDWLGFETALLEDYFADLLLSVADKTEVEWLKLKLQSTERPTYHTGEVAMPGTFECVKCGERIHLHKAGHIPPCPKCHHTEFKRLSYD